LSALREETLQLSALHEGVTSCGRFLRERYGSFDRVAGNARVLRRMRAAASGTLRYAGWSVIGRAMWIVIGVG
jgi:hypothetical protein